MDKLYQDQLRVWGDIQKLTNNYKKDGADRKRNPDYFQSRLLHLEELWNKFQCNHDRMLIEYSQDHKYFQEMEYEQSQGSYHSIKETLSQAYQDILLRMEKPKASTSVSEFEEQGTSERQESAQQQQGFGINTIKQKGLQYQNSNYTREHSKRVHTASKDFSEVLLATAKIKVLGVNGKPYLMRALIDQGSQISIISEKAAQLLKLKREGCNGVISGVGENTQRIKGQVTLTCTSIHTNYTLKTRVFIMNNLVHKLPNNSFNMPSWPYIKDIELADPEFNRSSQVDILFGADVYAQIMMSGILRGENLSQPIAQQTRFGWILCGKLKSYQCNIILNNTEDLQKFWEIEDIEESPSVVSSEDQYCLELYKKTTLRQANGKYKVRLPLKDNFKESLGLSKPMAVAQFHSLERKLAKQPKTARQYKDFINEYKDLGHMSFIENKGPEIGYYLPHHCVTREHSETTKLRVVFNGSAKTSTGLSLNDVMYTGPNLQQDLQSLILKWRRFRYVYTADVEKMFRNIDIFECDRKMQRIIWRNSQGRPLQEYELTTVTYGTKAAPFLAMMTLKQLAMDERPRFPRAAEITEQAFYTDDLIYGAHSIEEGCSMVTELQDLLQSGGFTLRKWASNEPRILKEISEKINRDQNQQIFTFKGDLISKTLGVYWNPKEDCFMFQSSFDFSNKTTKRALLSDISKLFDPLGWLAPAITAMKIIFQEVWKQNIKWDDQIPTSILKKWKQFKEEIELSISKIRIPRWLQTSPDSTLELHGFCDASNKAYAAVIYCRINNKVSLVAAKTKLVPVKGKISIPRGELCGAVLLTKLFNKVKACLGYNKIKCYGWTDSMVTLGWIQGQPEKWKPFVSNRVKQIVQDMPSNTWRYVKSEENPADCASRGISVKQLEMHSLWWNGPSWLPLYRNDKETQSYFTKEEEKNQYLVNIVQGTDNTVKGIIQNCSSFSRAIRIVAWILRLLPRNKDKRERYLTLAEVKEAKRKIIRNVQEDDFFYEIEKLRRKESINKSTLIALNPYLGQDGLLRVGGRLRNAFISKDMQHPIIISHTGRLTDLIIDQAHKLTFHGGPRLTLSLIRQKYWIVGGNRAVKRQLRLCVTCVKNNPRMQYQIMGDLPEARCNPARPFKHTGVDFTGYILIKSSKGRGIKCTKGYIAVFICMATKAVHLEVVSDLTTSAFLAALKRMAARRGTPEHIYSDNGTNFIGANRVLDSGYDELKRVFAEEQFATTITDMEINWHFNAPAWPSAGGLWEAAVKSLKAHTKKVIGDQKFTYEELSTLVAQLETCLNTRPLCPISEDPEDINFLTPAHFLTGGPTLSLLPTENDLRTRWYLVEKTFQDIWKRWQSEYLPTLTSRSKWQKPRENLKLQDLVAIHDANIPPGKWAMGRVVELHPGTDNIVRVVSLKTKNGVIKRPIVKLSPLPVQNSSKEAAENESNISAKPRPILRKSLGNVLAIMLSFIFFLTYVSATHPENYNISTFNNNKGLYLDKISNMQLIQEKWRIVVYYEMKPYWEGEKAFEQYYKTLQGMCSALDEKTHCEITMNQLRHSFEELKYYDQVLLTQHPGTRSKRRRRGLINGVGYAAHSLFGVLDESFAEQYQKDISLVKENEQHLANLWKNQTSVLEAEYNLMKRSEEENYNLRKLINRHANEVKKAITTQVTEINRLERITQFTLDSISATNVLANLRNMQEYLIDTITDIYHGTDLEDMRKEAPIISSVTFHDVHQYIALYSILGIFVVVGAILLLRRFRRAGTVAPVQQIPSGQATIPIQKTIDGQQETSIAALAAAVAASLAMGSTEPTRDRTPIGLSVSDSAVDWCRKC
ncbi:unnamed protein product [Pieris brassicae]|uniref:Integrase catalytic domain-containing protein n=1 Tax=Pieris brassicae TaxID=7116 RepID=A0A9P0T9P0_PIEBR|nr:unnamed protein product [Pieris brassicae]